MTGKNLQADRVGGANQFHHARILEEVQGALPAQKLRINQQTLNNSN